jgi:2-hydroxycyclohexanecarboxyl-CoA dehydrogenase
MSGRLAGRTAVITGGGQGVGRGIAGAFASAGAAVVILDIDPGLTEAAAADVTSRGAQGLGVVTDVADRAQVDAAVRRTVERFGGVDILVTSALSKLTVQPFVDTPPEAIETMWRVGYVGVVNAMQASFEYLQRGPGCVINFVSGAGINAGAGYASYGPVKEAVRALTRITAKEWGRYGIRVNNISPFARSDQFDEWAAANPEQAAAATRSAALGRVGDCEEDVGRAAVFLASEDAHYVTGHTLMVDGGQSMPL